MQEVGGLLVDQHRRLAASCLGQFPQLVGDVVLSHKFLWPGMVLVNHADHLQEAESRQRTRGLQHLHNDTSQTSNGHLNLQSTTDLSEIPSKFPGCSSTAISAYCNAHSEPFKCLSALSNHLNIKYMIDF